MFEVNLLFVRFFLFLASQVITAPSGVGPYVQVHYLIDQLIINLGGFPVVACFYGSPIIYRLLMNSVAKL